MNGPDAQTTKQQEEFPQDELSIAAGESGSAERIRAELDLAKHGVLLMKAGRLVVLLFLLTAALILFSHGNTAAAAFMGALWLIVLLTQTVAERWLASALNLSHKKLTELEFQIFLAPHRANALYLSPFLRLIPTVIALVAAMLFASLSESSSSDVLPWLSTLCGAFASGVSIAAPIAAYTVCETLRKRDIAVNDCLCIPRLARIRTLLADQSLFYGTRSAELRGFYADGVLHPLADLNFDEYLPLVLGFCHCDDGSLAAAFGFRQSLMDVVLRGMRTTPMEHRELLTPPSAIFAPYDPEIGYVCADLRFADGRHIAYRTGKPEVLLPQVTHILDKNVPRIVSPTDSKRLSTVLQNIYEIGRQAIALTQVSDDGTLIFIGYLFVSSEPVNGAENAVTTLRRNGVNLVYVSREQESCAYYRASTLGIAADAGRILTGTRIENFRPESLERAIPRVRIAAEMQAEQRAVLADALADRGGILAAASEDCGDGLFAGADITFSVPSEAKKADFSIKHCKITDISEVIQIARGACDAAVRAMHFAVGVSLTVAVFLLLAALSSPVLPLGAPLTAFLAILLPLPFALIIAARSAQIPVAEKPLFGFAEKSVHHSLRKKPVGKLFFAWQIFTALFGAWFASALYASLLPVSQAGIPAASGAAFLTLTVYSILSAAIAYSWGSSLFYLIERKNRTVLWMGILLFALVFAALRTDTVNVLFGLETVAFRYLPQTLIPSILIALLYEFGLLLARALSRGRR